MSLTLTNIPKIMNHHKWTTGEKLMKQWFTRPAKSAPDYTDPDNTTVTVDWTLGFDRAKKVYDKIFKDRSWANEAAKVEIRKMLDKKGLLTDSGASFGIVHENGSDLEAEYINFRAVEYAAKLDDMSAALGRFSYRMVVGGEVEPDGDKHKVTIKQVGIYIRDSYDFEGDQDLGYWDDSDNSVSFLPGTGTKVTNKSFRDWRTANSKGGDFMVFCKVKLTTLATTDVFTV